MFDNEKYVWRLNKLQTCRNIKKRETFWKWIKHEIWINHHYSWQLVNIFRDHWTNFNAVCTLRYSLKCLCVYDIDSSEYKIVTKLFNMFFSNHLFIYTSLVSLFMYIFLEFEGKWKSIVMLLIVKCLNKLNINLLGNQN